MRVRNQIILGIAGIAVLIALIGALVFRNLEKGPRKLIEFQNEALYLSQAMESSLHDAETRSLAYVLSGVSSGKEDFYLKLKEFDEKTLQFIQVNQLNESEKAVLERKLLEEVQRGRKALEERAEELFLIYEKRGNTGQELLLKYDEVIDILCQDMEKLIANEKEDVATAQRGALQALESYRTYSLLFSLAAVILALPLAFFVSRTISRPVEHLCASTHAIAEGKLGTEIGIKRTGDVGKLADSIDLMRVRLKETITRLEDEIRMHREARKELTLAQERMNFLMRYSPAVIYACKPYGDYGTTFITESVRDVMGFEASQFLGDSKFWAEHIHSEDAQRVFAEFPKLFERGRHTHEYRFLHKDGHYRWMYDAMTLVKDAEDRPVEIVGQWVNITDRKRAEEQTKIINEELEKRSAELQEQRMRADEARMLAEAADRTKSEFLANMSHELTTPLNTIIGFAQVLQDELHGKLNEKQNEYAGEILNGGLHLLDLIVDLLELSKMEAGQGVFKPGKFRVKDVLQSSLSLFKEEALKHSIGMRYELEPEADIEIEADRVKINQALFHLVSNAVKFTPNGGEVTLSAQRIRLAGLEEEKKEPGLSPHDGEGDFVQFSVSDTGIGIATKDIPDLFQMFRQLESPYTKRYKGVGLGLILTRKFIELHGGKIWVKSEPGKGSTFRFIIPIKAGQHLQPTTDAVTGLLTWDHFQTHMERILSMHSRKNQQFGLLRIELTQFNELSEILSIVNILKSITRKHEVLAQGNDLGSYYLILLEAGKRAVDDAVIRITRLMREMGYSPVIKKAIFLEDGRTMEELMKVFHNQKG